ncbi:MAG: ketoacyl-ACP synthase III [Myxococcota bacterium]
MGVRIVGTGLSVPDSIQTAEELSPLVGRSPEWIRSRTGVVERRVASEPSFVYGARAARQALGDGGPPDLVINASLTPYQLIPDTSVFLMRELGYEGIPSFSVHATCLSFLVAVAHSAVPLLQCGTYRRILVVSAEIATISRDFEHPESAVLLGDGAGAAVLERHEGTSGLLGFAMRTVPSGAELAELPGSGTRYPPEDPETPAGSTKFRMNGPRIYRLASAHLRAVVDEVLEPHGLTPEQVDVCIPHQASGPALQAMRAANVAGGNLIDLIPRYGNCIAAGVPMALHEAVTTGRVKRGDKVLFVGTGAGLHSAAALLEY